MRVIVPYAAGGASDIAARVMAQAAQGIEGAPALAVENRGGGASIPGTQAILAAPPDGATIGVVDTAIVINPGLFGSARLPYDVERDATPVGVIATSPLALVAHPSAGAETVAALVARMQAEPGRIDMGHAGNGTAVHLANAQFLIAAGVEAVVVAAYRGGGPLLAALVGGEVRAGFLSVPAARPHVEAGRLRALAVTGPARSAVLPGVPSFAEAGLPAVDALPFFGVVAPAGLPAELVRRVHALMVAPARANPATAARLEELGYTVVAGGPAEFAAMIRAETAKWRAVIARAGIVPD
jgi:tripartite-type tricarboxylate transporter receptor subunit TctC